MNKNSQFNIVDLIYTRRFYTLVCFKESQTDSSRPPIKNLHKAENGQFLSQHHIKTKRCFLKARGKQGHKHRENDEDALKKNLLLTIKKILFKLSN